MKRTSKYAIQSQVLLSMESSDCGAFKARTNEDETIKHNDDDGDDVQTDGPIDIGDVLPSITLKNEKGEDVDTGTIAAEKGAVLFLVPKADTRRFSKFASISCRSYISCSYSWVHYASLWLPRYMGGVHLTRLRRLWGKCRRTHCSE